MALVGVPYGKANYREGDSEESEPQGLWTILMDCSMFTSGECVYYSYLQLECVALISYLEVFHRLYE